jgi:hypothetical protein
MENEAGSVSFTVKITITVAQFYRTSYCK